MITIDALSSTSRVVRLHVRDAEVELLWMGAEWDERIISCGEIPPAEWPEVMQHCRIAAASYAFANDDAWRERLRLFQRDGVDATCRVVRENGRIVVRWDHEDEFALRCRRRTISVPAFQERQRALLGERE